MSSFVVLVVLTFLTFVTPHLLQRGQKEDAECGEDPSSGMRRGRKGDFTIFKFSILFKLKFSIFLGCAEAGEMISNSNLIQN